MVTGKAKVAVIAEQNFRKLRRETPRLEGFSSVGPATVLFDDAGRRLSRAEQRDGALVVLRDAVLTWLGFPL